MLTANFKIKLWKSQHNFCLLYTLYFRQKVHSHKVNLLSMAHNILDIPFGAFESGGVYVLDLLLEKLKESTLSVLLS